MKDKYKDSNKYFVAAIPNNLFDNFCSDIEKFINCFKPIYDPKRALYRNANLDIQIIEKTIQDQENKFRKYVSQGQEFNHEGFYHYIDRNIFLKPKKYKLSEFDILYKKLDNQNAYFMDLYNKFDNLCFHNNQIPNIDNFENDEYDFLSKYYNYVLRYINTCFRLCSIANDILSGSISSFVKFDEEDFDEDFD